MSTPENFMLPCLNKQILGFDCLGCGLQRSVALLFQGNILAAFKMYPAVFPLLALFLFIGLHMFFKFKHGIKIINLLAIITIGFIIGSFIIKLIIT
ncbi:DUF2752 domain-containing protein [Bizionia sediminis]|uniref:DUF2752 domain-containing protein n=1 Tax=Bizionia sediminis TaxID=1737064 RepID=A0ABW5KTK3_9FLAO